MFFSNFSYYETKTKNGFLSRHSCDSTYTKDLPKNGDFVFPEMFTEQMTSLQNQLLKFLNVLFDNNFGFNETFFLLKEVPKEINAAHLLNWYKSLYFENAKLEKGTCVVDVKSNLDTTFSKSVYIKDEPLPQEAIDTFVFFASSSGKIYSSFGTKVKTDYVNICFPGKNIIIQVLKTGIFGKVILGEHQEENEKQDMMDSYSDLIKHTEKTKCEYLKITGRKVKPAMRALAEEFGFKSDDFKFDAYIIGKDTKPGRDPRYWTFGKDNEYGYERKSESVMVALIAKCEAPATIPQPEDTKECSKGVIVDVDYALREFTKTGNLKCAFESHPRQFGMCVKLLPKLIMN